MQHRNVAREVGLVVASLAVLVHWLDQAPALLATVLIVATAAASTGPVVGEWRPWRMPLIPMVLPALAAVSSLDPSSTTIISYGWSSSSRARRTLSTTDAIPRPRF